MTFRIEGMPEIERALEGIAKQSTQVAVTRRALTQAAIPMRDLARQYAPIDQGDLAANIIISLRATGEVGRAAYAASMRETGGDTAAAVTAMRGARRAFKANNPPAILYMGPTKEIWYAHFPEFGTGPRVNGGQFAGTQHPGTAPDPYLRPAFDAQAKPTIDRLAPLIMQEINKSAKRAAKKAAKKG